jgi:hypothetical protein
MTLLIWDGWLSLVRAIRYLPPGLPRHERRRLDKLAWTQRNTSGGRRLPTLAMLPSAWMVLTHVITLPIGHNISPFLRITSPFGQAITEIGEKMAHLDHAMVLDTRVLLQIINIKSTHLFHSIVSPLDSSHLFDHRVVAIKAKPRSVSISLSQLVDCWETDPRAHGPPTVESSTNEPVSIPDFEQAQECIVEDPSAFMVFNSRSTIRQPVIFDTGASLAITPDKADFDGPLTIPKGDLRLGGMANGLKIEGLGAITWTFSNGTSDEVVVRGMAYYVPKSKARLLSPQRLFDTSTGVHGRYEGDQHSFRLHFSGSPPLVVEYDERNSLPIGYATIGPVPSPIHQPQLNLTILNDANQNLTVAQKLLLHWHYRFGHLNLPSVQRLFRAVPFLSIKFAASAKCAITGMRCDICEYAKAHRRSRHHATNTPNDIRDGHLKKEHLKPGVQVSVDHVEARLLGRTFDSYGKALSATYKGGCIFVDHCSGFLHVEHQLGFSAVETVRAKQAYEQLALHHGVVIESYLTDSGAFKANAFVEHIRSHAQRIRFCGANAHHKNGIAERAVQSVSNMARSLILHASAHWKDGIDSSLWPMAVTYATHLYNHLPNAQGLCPADLFTGSTVPRHRLKDIHVWGCPIYILDPQLQAGQKLPRWEPRSRRGVFMGFSNLHSSEVPLVLNLETGSITPQFHVVFDDLFSTVSSVERENEPPDNWDQLCLENTTLIPVENNHDHPADWNTPDTMQFDWMTPEAQELLDRATTRQAAIRAHQPTATAPLATAPCLDTVRPLPSAPTSLAPTASTSLAPTTLIPPSSSDAPSVISSGDSAGLPPLISRPTSISSTVASAAIPATASMIPSVPLPTVVRRPSRANKGTWELLQTQGTSTKCSGLLRVSSVSPMVTMLLSPIWQNYTLVSTRALWMSSILACMRLRLPRIMPICQHFNKR